MNSMVKRELIMREQRTQTKQPTLLNAQKQDRMPNDLINKV
jgi:hypothetical protein